LSRFVRVVDALGFLLVRARRFWNRLTCALPVSFFGAFFEPEECAVPNITRSATCFAGNALMFSSVLLNVLGAATRRLDICHVGYRKAAFVINALSFLALHIRVWLVLGE